MKNPMFIQPALQNISELPIISQVNNELHQNKGNHGVQTSLVLILDVVLCRQRYLCTNMDIRTQNMLGILKCSKRKPDSFGSKEYKKLSNFWHSQSVSDLTTATPFP